MMFVDETKILLVVFIIIKGRDSVFGLGKWCPAPWKARGCLEAQPMQFETEQQQ